MILEAYYWTTHAMQLSLDGQYYCISWIMMRNDLFETKNALFVVPKLGGDFLLLSLKEKNCGSELLLFAYPRCKDDCG